MVMILVRDKIRDNIYCPTLITLSIPKSRCHLLNRTRKKPRAGFLLSKQCQIDIAVVQALLNADFVLYTTCFDRKEQVQLEQQVDVSKNGGSLVHYSKMLPVDFSKLLRKVSSLYYWLWRTTGFTLTL